LKPTKKNLGDIQSLLVQDEPIAELAEQVYGVVAAQIAARPQHCVIMQSGDGAIAVVGPFYTLPAARKYAKAQPVVRVCVAPVNQVGDPVG
jgi:hypothetical protein